ncbi:glycosyltransferase [Pseudomonas sp. R5(2019)]|uniref:glycosyltransferase n=1 Tax=Pseudomonas sp. R5(2019) TaxID=2697566 RepID=UPI00141246F4|nr:glycosyltransferase [Pseudomonas sp. R5(2019)]NBA93962.1 glycosyltransferase [Pseudomonas sp. R5(2019)]
MNVINVMWAGGSPYASVHKVHQQILSFADSGASINTWLLQGKATGCIGDIGKYREWHLPHRLLKGRHVWAVLKRWMQARLRKAVAASGAQVLLLDGIGVARMLLPALVDLDDIRVIVIFHGVTRLRASDRALLRAFPSSRLALVAVSRTLATDLQEDLNLSVMALRSALEPTNFCSRLLSRDAARRELAINEPNVKVMGAVGRLVADKGFDYLLEAFSTALKEQSDLRLVIVGEGPDRLVLERQIRRHGLESKVMLPGHRNGLDRCYRAFDWLLIPSREEGLGLVLQEAVMAGVPVLVSDLTVFREQLGDAGFYAAAGDQRGWAQAIARCASLDAKQVSESQFRALSPEAAWQRFSLESRLLLSSKPASGRQ